MSGQQLIHTVCLNTKDAIYSSEGSFSMRLGGDNPRIKPIKVALGSLEFPMVQWTIEEDWARIYFSEGFRPTAESSFLRIGEESESDGKQVVIAIPLYMNEILRWSRHGSSAVATCRDPHNLWVEGRRCVISALSWGNVQILCSPMGTFSLTDYYHRNALEYISEREFMIKNIHCDLSNTFPGYLHTPTYPSPELLCQVLTFVISYTTTLSQYQVVYDATRNRASLEASIFPVNSNSLTVRIFASKLAQLLGYPSEHERRIVRNSEAPAAFDFQQRFESSSTDDLPLRLPSEHFAGWSYVSLEPGWYAPSHRPMCTGQPLRLPQEADMAFNRLFFGVPERIPQGTATGHFLIFSDPSGNVHYCGILCGRYTPETFCAHVESEMNRMVSHTLPGIEFSVTYEDRRFVFSCESRVEQQNITHVSCAPFALMLNHPASFDATRIGFGPYALQGTDTYTSKEIDFPYFSYDSRVPRNVYKLTEIGHQKRLRLQAVSIPTMTAIIADYKKDTSELAVYTYAGQLPFAHGLHPGDLVRMTSFSSSVELYEFIDENQEWGLRSYPRCPLAPGMNRNAVVVAKKPSALKCKASLPSCTVLWIRVRTSDALADCIGQVIALNVEVEPYNLCTDVLHRTIPASMLGFFPGATQWGVDGTILSGELRIPPFEAPAVHALDHPDYVLLYIDEGKKSTALQHTSNNNSTSPFAKLVLYPNFREERMLPRETNLLSGESFPKFTIRFMNPDGTPYHFHGANFSFSLNFVSVPE